MPPCDSPHPEQPLVTPFTPTVTDFLMLRNQMKEIPYWPYPICFLNKHVNLKRNLTDDEYKLLQSFKENKYIIIRKADKGETIVIMDPSDYDRNLEEILNSNNYQPLSKNPTEKIERKIYIYMFIQIQSSPSE